MKKTFLYIFAMMLLLVSCDSSDDSTLPEGTLPTIEIADFQEGGYNIVSYRENFLQIEPQITTGYTESQLSYHWYLVNNSSSDIAYTTNKEYTWELISSERNLNYEINLAPGNYTVCLDVTADNGYTASKQCDLLVSTDFTAGYYILKETADGNTELDVFNYTDNNLIKDLFEATTGEALPGAPVMLSMSFDHSYIDENTNMETSGNLATITTDKGLIRGLYTGDLSAVLRNDNILYDTWDNNVQPYLIGSGLWTNVLVTSEGAVSQYAASMGGGSGKYGIAGGAGGSRFYVLDASGYTTVLWAEAAHTLYYLDYNGGPGYFDDPTYNVNNMSGWECIAAGNSRSAGVVVFLLQNTSTKARQLVYVSTNFMGGTIAKMVTVDPSTHLAKGNVFTVSNQSSSFIYTVDNNRIYGYDLNSGEEQEIPAPGISGETITYISDKYVRRTTDYFVIGTQNGNDYTLRFYEQLGGKPDGNPVYTVKGSGKVVSVKYTDTQFSGFSGLPAMMD